MKVGRLLGAAVLTAIAAAALCASMLAPHDPHEQHAGFPSAPPMRPHIIDNQGIWRWPFVYRLQLIDRLDRRYVEDRSSPIRIAAVWAGDELPVFLLGTDPLGRDVLSRLLFGSRASMGIAAAASAGALLIGIIIGAVAGYRKGAFDEAAMRMSEMILVLPVVYVVLAVRAAMPLVLDAAQVFTGVSAVLALLGWPVVARGVRAVVAVESNLDYVEAARACGASASRLMLRHLLPATVGFVATQAALLLPAFIIAEATLSFAGFGFSEPTPSWGTMLQDAGNVSAFAEHPWLLAPAAAIAAVSWAMHSLAGASREAPLLLGTRPRP